MFLLGDTFLCFRLCLQSMVVLDFWCSSMLHGAKLIFYWRQKEPGAGGMIQ
jgi:hypothetical protein